MAQIIRYMVSDFLNTGTSETPIWSLMGTGFNSLDEQPNAQVDSKIYVSDKSSTKNIISYETVFPFDIDTFNEEASIMAIYNIARNQKTGKDAILEYVRTDFTVDQTGKPISPQVMARKFNVAVEVTEFSGGGGETLKIAGNLNGVGDFVNGIFDLTSRSLSVAGDDAPVLTVTSEEGETSGKTAISVSPALIPGDSYLYKIDAIAPIVKPKLFDTLSSGWTSWDGKAEITAEDGKTITVAEVTSDQKCVRVGSATVVAAE